MVNSRNALFTDSSKVLKTKRAPQRPSSEQAWQNRAMRSGAEKISRVLPDATWNLQQIAALDKGPYKAP